MLLFTIRDYRFSSRIRHRAAATVARRRGQRTLESQLDPEAQLRISQTRRARMVPAEVLYDSSFSNPNHRVYQHYSERRLLVTEEGQQEDLSEPHRRQLL
ncbi:hypothetical protein L1987_59137 [Smallanthus sonchifolius]|uniref:Uncharacterized protein n=1 Tax=Smallanthus sonchifolius TaxID=185202 RepID=A0ACB9D4S0_9ASTR|nr:hypothetical protein L1987_59137 [Smallanthus sonchifolius]